MADRPQFNQLMADIEAGQIKVLVVDDLTRLSRSEDMPTLIARLKFMGVHVISVDGFNSESEDARLQTWVRGMMGNIYLDDLAKKTHRGLKGRVLSGHSAGGQAFGYKSEPVYEGKSIIGYQRRVVETEAEVIRQIFSLYADGWSARRIAEELNRQGVASPRGTSWVFTAIQGHAKNKSGILHNEAYIGREIWNKSKWVKDPLTGKRKRIDRPQSEWVINEDEALRIVPDDLWQRVKKRHQSIADKTAAQRKATGRKISGGRPPRHLLSGFMKCAECGANYTLVGKTEYACASYRNRGRSVCANHIHAKRAHIEQLFRGYIENQLLSEKAFSHLEKELKRFITGYHDTSSIRKEIERVESEIKQIVNAIKQGIFTSSTKAALEELEAEKNHLETHLEAADTKPEIILKKARAAYIELVKDIHQVRDTAASRAVIEELIGEIHLTPNLEHGALTATCTKNGLAATFTESLVAGAHNRHYLLFHMREAY